MSTKLHAAADALGNPVRLLLGPGQRHDVTRSHELIEGLKPEAVIADKGCDAGHLHQAIHDAGAEAVIPPRSNRKAPRTYDKALYKERNLIETVWAYLRGNWLSNRVFSSYDNIVDHCCHAWNRLADQPWKIMALGTRAWAHGF